MVLLLFILTIALLLTLEALRKSLAQTSRSQSPAGEYALTATDRIKNPVTYYHPGHCWVALETPALSRIGVDDVSRLLIGKPEAVTLPNVGDFIRQGEPIVRLHRNGKSLTQVSPISGVVEETLSLPFDNIGKSSGDEAMEGWFVKLRPFDFARDCVNLLSGSSAHQWLEATRLDLLRHFAPQLGLLAQDGGAMHSPLSALLNEQEWNTLVRQVFPNVRPSSSSHVSS